MDLYSRDADDLSDIKRAILRGYEDDDSDDSDTGDVDEELYDQELKEDDIKPSLEEDVEELGTAMRVIFAEESIFPVSANLVSAMKGSREKQGQSPRELKVNWAPDVYDPEPSMLLPARGEKQKKSKKNKEIDEDYFDNKKKTGKKGQKGENPRGGGGGSGKDKKQLKKAARGSDRSLKRGAFSDDS